jgi:hypothetical protein
MIWLFAFLIGTAHAGYLQIVGESSVRLEKLNQNLRLVGEYQIKNQGDETARNVYPEIQIDQFSWHGEPVMLDAGTTHVWKISQTIASSQLVLPPLGRFALVIFHHYEDLNAYPFEIPSVQLLTVGAPMQSREPSVQLTVLPVNSGIYSAQYSIANSSGDKLHCLPMYVIPREMELRSPELPLDIPGGGELAGSFLFENKSGLIGSNYHAFLVLRWVENNMRQASFVGANFLIEKNQTPAQAWNPEQIFWAWWFWITACGLIGMWAFWIRPLQKLGKSKK